MFVPNVKMHASNSFEGGKVIIWEQEFWDKKKKEDTEEWYWYCVKSKCCINLAIMYT